MIFLNSRIENDIRILQRRFEVQTLIGCATAECDIRLSMGQMLHSPGEIITLSNVFALTLMDGNCPCRIFIGYSRSVPYFNIVKTAMLTIVVVNRFLPARRFNGMHWQVSKETLIVSFWKVPPSFAAIHSPSVCLDRFWGSWSGAPSLNMMFFVRRAQSYHAKSPSIIAFKSIFLHQQLGEPLKVDRRGTKRSCSSQWLRDRDVWASPKIEIVDWLVLESDFSSSLVLTLFQKPDKFRITRRECSLQFYFFPAYYSKHFCAAEIGSHIIVCEIFFVHDRVHRR